MKRLYVGVVNVREGNTVTNEIFVDWGDDAQSTEAEWLFRASKKNPNGMLAGSICHDITEFAANVPQ